MSRPAITDLVARLEAECLSLLVLKAGEEIYSSYLGGVRPLLDLVDWFPGGLPGAVVVDRVVGGCAARVFAALRVKKVLGLTGSISAEHILYSAGVDYVFQQVVTDIRNRDNSGICPFEQLSARYTRAEELVPAMRQKLAELRQPR